MLHQALVLVSLVKGANIRNVLTCQLYDSDLRFPIRALPSDSSYLVHPDTFDFYIDMQSGQSYACRVSPTNRHGSPFQAQQIVASRSVLH